MSKTREALEAGFKKVAEPKKVVTNTIDTKDIDKSMGVSYDRLGRVTDAGNPNNPFDRGASGNEMRTTYMDVEALKKQLSGLKAHRAMLPDYKFF